MKHNLTKYKVPCSGKKEAKYMRYMLESLGEKISDVFFAYVAIDNHLYFNTVSRCWSIGVANFRSETTLPDLIKMIIENQAEESKKKGEFTETIKPKSILEGKVAIDVEGNERYFKLLMNHYESKRWVSADGDKPNDVKLELGSPYFRYENHFGYSLNYAVDNGYKIIPFSDFAKEVGIKIPEFVMKSEDGVDLYEGDGMYCAEFSHNRWVYDDFCGFPYSIAIDSLVVTNPTVNKAFSTKEAAEKWIKEKDEPDYVEVVNDRGESICIKKDGTIWVKNNAGFLRISYFNINHFKTLFEKHHATYGTNS